VAIHTKKRDTKYNLVHIDAQNPTDLRVEESQLYYIMHLSRAPTTLQDHFLFYTPPDIVSLRIHPHTRTDSHTFRSRRLCGRSGTSPARDRDGAVSDVQQRYESPMIGPLFTRLFLPEQERGLHIHESIHLYICSCRLKPEHGNYLVSI